MLENHPDTNRTRSKSLIHLKSNSDIRGFVESTTNGFAGFRYRNSLREYFAGINGASDKYVIYDNNASSERVAVLPNVDLQANFGLQVGQGTVLNSIQAGTLTAVPSGGSTLVVTLTYPSAFSAIPIVVATPRTETG